MSVVIHDPPNTLQFIGSFWLFIAVDELGEGVMAAPIKGQFMPLLAADEARLKSLMPIARQMAALTKKRIKLVKFTAREEIEEIFPE